MGFLSRIGVGAATVDTILATDTVRPGESIDAHVEIEGGNDDQEVEELELAVATRYQIPTDEGTAYETAEIAETELTEGFTIEAGTERTMDVPPIDIPVTTPATISQTEVWIQTGLEIDWSADPTDEDHLTVEPGPYLDALLTAVEGLGLDLEYADNTDTEFLRWEGGAGTGFGTHEFVQFFEYENHGGAVWSDLDDIEFYVAPAADHLDVQIEVESTGGGLLDSGERDTSFTVTSTDPDEVATTVRSVVDDNLV